MCVHDRLKRPVRLSPNECARPRAPRHHRSESLAAPGKGLKAGLHHSGPVADPDAEEGPDTSVAAWTAGWVATRFPEAGETLGAETCLYTNTSDEEFVLERHGRVVVGSACSGHGFKFAPIVGRTLAALAREAAE